MEPNTQQRKYTFIGWSNNVDSTVNTNKTAQFYATKDIIYTANAQWTIQEYYLILMKDSNTLYKQTKHQWGVLLVLPEGPSKDTVTESTTRDVPVKYELDADVVNKPNDFTVNVSATKDTKYEFKSWYMAEDPNTEYNSGTDYRLTTTTTFYAKYKTTISYTLPNKMQVTLSNIIPIKQGYRFVGWYCKHNTTEIFQPGTTISIDTLNGETGYPILCALWKKASILVKYKNNNIWTDGVLNIKDDGTYKEVETAYIKQNGSWKQLQ